MPNKNYFSLFPLSGDNANELMFRICRFDFIEQTLLRVLIFLFDEIEPTRFELISLALLSGRE